VNKAETFFTDTERQRIAATTRSVECCTIGEVAVMVVESSDEYAETEVLGGVLLGSLISLLVTVAFLHSSLWFYIPLSILFFLPGRIFFRKALPLKRSLIGPGRVESAVRQRAVRAFYEKGLYKTRMNTGVLFFISLLEHKVWVLADKGIYEKIDQEALNKFARAVSLGVKEGRACDALCQAIIEAGDVLAKHFPLTPGDTNELTDKVITE
jgi:putative membrane protein